MAWILASLLGTACAKEAPLEFAVTFDNAGGIERGDEVYYKGLEIGEVRSVGVDQSGDVRVDVAVAAKYRDAITTGSMIEIERAGLLGGRQLTVRDGDGPREPLRAGDVLVGTLGPVSGAVTSLRDVSTRALSSLQQRAGDLQERLRSAQESGDSTAEEQDGDDAESPATKQLAELRQALEELRRESSAAADESRDTSTDPEVQRRIAEVQQQMSILREKLAAEGEELRQQIQPLLEDLERWLRRDPTRPDSPE